MHTVEHHHQHLSRPGLTSSSGVAKAPKPQPCRLYLLTPPAIDLPSFADTAALAYGAGAARQVAIVPPDPGAAPFVVSVTFRVDRMSESPESGSSICAGSEVVPTVLLAASVMTVSGSVSQSCRAGEKKGAGSSACNRKCQFQGKDSKNLVRKEETKRGEGNVPDAKDFPVSARAAEVPAQ